MGKEIIDIKKAASILGILTATARNWVKCGYQQKADILNKQIDALVYRLTQEEIATIEGEARENY